MIPPSAHILSGCKSSQTRVDGAQCSDTGQRTKCFGWGGLINSEESGRRPPLLTLGRKGSQGPSSLSWQCLEAQTTLLGHLFQSPSLDLEKSQWARQRAATLYKIRVSELYNSAHWDKIPKVIQTHLCVSLRSPLETSSLHLRWGGKNRNKKNNRN